MKATELRIGNYVWDDYSGEMIVWAISNNINTPLSDIGLKKKTHLPSGGYKIKNIAPIPLTKQWLKDFGFVDKGTIFKKGWFELWYSSYAENHQLRIYKVSNDIEKTINIKYVHQLQNLYFALTGKELTK